jgi:hypothetical protein
MLLMLLLLPVVHVKGEALTALLTVCVPPVGVPTAALAESSMEDASFCTHAVAAGCFCRAVLL